MTQQPHQDPTIRIAEQPQDPPRRKDRRLGRGLASLISLPPSPPTDSAGGLPATGIGLPSAPLAEHAMLTHIHVRHIVANPRQPRRQFDEAALAGLAESLKANGLIQPVLVRRRQDHAPAGLGQDGQPVRPIQNDQPRFELVAGERRWRAAQLAGLETVPAIVKALDDDDALELSLVENVQRQDLNPIERAGGYKAVLDRAKLSQDQLAQRLGESQASVSQYLRLLDLPQAVQQMVADGRISFGHARALGALRRPETQQLLADHIVKGQMPVREVEKLIAGCLRLPAGEDLLLGTLEGSAASDSPGKLRVRKPVPPKPANIVALEEKLTRRLGTRVFIHQGRRADMGKVVIDFYCLDDFDRILEALNVTAD